MILNEKRIHEFHLCWASITTRDFKKINLKNTKFITTKTNRNGIKQNNCLFLQLIYFFAVKRKKYTSKSINWENAEKRDDEVGVYTMIATCVRGSSMVCVSECAVLVPHSHLLPSGHVSNRRLGRQQHHQSTTMGPT
jgi:hypothetical protein